MELELSSSRPSGDEFAYESVELLRTQIKEIEGKWNDELKRLETAQKDKEELEKILRVLQTLNEYEREATLKMEVTLQETREALGIPAEASRPGIYNSSKSLGSSCSRGSSVLEFDLVYNPNAVLKVPLKPPLVSVSPQIPDIGSAAPPPQQTPSKPTSKPKFSPGWKSRITSILVSINNHNRSNPLSLSPRSFDSTTPLFVDALDSPSTKSKRAAKSQKRPSQDSENYGTVSWRNTAGSAGGMLANRANRDVSRKKPSDLPPIPQS